jgi:hypothetical protein
VGASGFTTLAKGDNTGVDLSTILNDRIKSNEDWSSFWQAHASKQYPHPSIPSVDFSKDEVIVVALPYAGALGSVEIIQIRKRAEETFVWVRARDSQPSKNELVPLVIKKPYHFIKLRRSEHPIRFIWDGVGSYEK